MLEAFVIKAYDSIYNTPSQISYYFQPAYVNSVNASFNGSESGDTIDGLLSGANVATTTLFNPVFVASFLGSGEATMKADIAENDIYNWKPSAPTVLFHGQSDDTVFYANSTTAFQAMQANGSTSVSLHNCDAGTLPTTHGNCIGPYFTDMYAFFFAVATGL